MATVVKFPGIKLTLAGAEYVFAPLSLNAIGQLQERLEQFDGNVLNREQRETAAEAAFCSLKRNYPEITREEVGELVDVGNFVSVFEAVMDVAGLKRKAIEEAATGGALGEAPTSAS